MGIVLAIVLQLTAGTAQCAASPLQDLLPRAIAPMAGASPAWFVDGSFGKWLGPDAPVKSVWVLSRDVSGDLQVRGRQLDGQDSLTFRRGMTGPVEPSLQIHAPLAESMIPGGASAEVMRKFAFVSSYVFYPSPGCWRLDVQFGRYQIQVVVFVR